MAGSLRVWLQPRIGLASAAATNTDPTCSEGPQETTLTLICLAGPNATTCRMSTAVEPTVSIRALPSSTVPWIHHSWSRHQAHCLQKQLANIKAQTATLPRNSNNGGRLEATRNKTPPTTTRPATTWRLATRLRLSTRTRTWWND